MHDQERKLKDEYPFFGDKDREKDFIYAEMGNMRPVIEDAKGVRFQSREAILCKDGTAKLFSLQQKDPIAPTLRHKGPIRELTFFDHMPLLITLSDESVKVWDGLTGELRKELDGQTIQPMWLSFAPGAQRFVTMESERKAVTVWDAVALNAVATLHLHGVDRVVAAGLSGDGKTVVIFRFSPDPSAELYDVASGLTFATLRLPSSAVGEVFGEGGKQLNKAGLKKVGGQRDTHSWEVVQSLAPTSGKPNEPQAKP